MAARGGKTQRTKPQKLTGGLGMKLVLALLLVLVSWQLYSLQGQVAAAEAEKAEYESQVEALRQENDALAADIEEGATEEMMEEIARKELGGVTPGEYVFSHRGN